MLMKNTLESVIWHLRTHLDTQDLAAFMYLILAIREMRRSPYCKNAVDKKHSSERKDTYFVYSSG